MRMNRFVVFFFFHQFLAKISEFSASFVAVQRTRNGVRGKESEKMSAKPFKPKNRDEKQRGMTTMMTTTTEIRDEENV